MATTQIDLLRHGEAQGGQRYRGTTDDPLSEQGWIQMEAVTTPACKWNEVVTSPLNRCAQFARTLSRRLAIPLYQESAFREIAFGDWEGCSADELMVRDGQALARYYDDPWHNTPPGGEPLTAFQARVLAGWHALLADQAGAHILLISHGGVMRTILNHVLGLPASSLFKLHIPYACVSRVRIDGEGESALSCLLSHNGSLQP